MIERATLWGVGLGVVIGALVGAAVPLPAAGSPTPVPHPGRVAPVPSQAPSTGRCPDVDAELDAAIDAAWSALEEADAALLEAEAEVSDLIGERPGFEHLPQELQPEVIEEHVLDLLDESAGTLEWIDCSESPCIAVLSVPDSETATLRAAADPIRDGLASDYPWEAFGVQGEWWVTVPLGPGSDDVRGYHRVDLREETIILELLHAEFLR